MEGMHAAMMEGGSRLHLQHGPIDLVILADSSDASGRARAYDAAIGRFSGLLQELVDELPFLRDRARQDGMPPNGPVAIRMHGAVLPHCNSGFVTPMAAVAGAVADEILSAMVAAARLKRAYVNNGGDIALQLEQGQQFTIALAGLDGEFNGKATIDCASGIGGVASSGQGGRSHSLGIADTVTVLGKSAAAADAAATLVANAVDLPDHSGIERRPANELDPDSDLGSRPVVVRAGHLEPDDVNEALSNGVDAATEMQLSGLLESAALHLRGSWRVVGNSMCFREVGDQEVRDVRT